MCSSDLEVTDLLIIDPNRLDEVVETQAAIFDDIMEAASASRSERDEAKSKAAEKLSELFLKFKDDARKVEQKMTDTEAMKKAERDSSYQKLYDEYLDLKDETEIWSNKKESFLHRASMIKERCKLYDNNYKDSISLKGNVTTDRVSYDQIREKLKRNRK